MELRRGKVVPRKGMWEGHLVLARDGKEMHRKALHRKSL